jgi:pimeloyl-ACP methyl ester carboxylesterase
VVIARLHHELVAGSSPRRWLAFLHGICGSGANLRGVARRVVSRRPDWGIALVDLRGHGRSDDGAPPHTLEACAADVLAVSLPGELAAIAGHSFGGKVAMLARRHRPVAQTWVLDASPSARPRGLGEGSQVAALLATMATLPRAWPTRDAYIAAIVADGHALPLAQWLAMSLRDAGDGSGLVSRLDLAQIRALLADYDACDAWDAIALPGDVEVIAATRGSALDISDLVRLEAMANVHVHRVAAGHWVHVDAPDAVVDLLATKLAGSEDS